jgi:protein-S-isoprenylcysteine O-methyltransferase Ste14
MRQDTFDMQSVAAMTRAMTAVPRTLANACPSSWISWICYWGALWFACDVRMGREIITLGPAFWVAAAGLVIFFSAVVAIQRHMRLALSANSYGSPERLVDTGVFRYSRNPIYVAFLVPLASLAYASVPVAAAAMAVYMASMTWLVIRREERVLAARFGDRYRAYSASVPRWIF